MAVEAVPRSKWKTAFTVLFFVILVGVLGLVGYRMYQEVPRVTLTDKYGVIPELNMTRFPPETKAPRFSLPDLNGQTINLDDLKGRVVLLTFRTTW